MRKLLLALALVTVAVGGIGVSQRSVRADDGYTPAAVSQIPGITRRVVAQKTDTSISFPPYASLSVTSRLYEYFLSNGAYLCTSAAYTLRSNLPVHATGTARLSVGSVTYAAVAINTVVTVTGVSGETFCRATPAGSFQASVVTATAGPYHGGPGLDGQFLFEQASAYHQRVER